MQPRAPGRMAVRCNSLNHFPRPGADPLSLERSTVDLPRVLARSDSKILETKIARRGCVEGDGGVRSLIDQNRFFRCRFVVPKLDYGKSRIDIFSIFFTPSNIWRSDR